MENFLRSIYFFGSSARLHSHRSSDGTTNRLSAELIYVFLKLFYFASFFCWFMPLTRDFHSVSTCLGLAQFRSISLLCCEADHCTQKMKKIIKQNRLTIQVINWNASNVFKLTFCPIIETIQSILFPNELKQASAVNSDCEPQYYGLISQMNHLCSPLSRMILNGVWKRQSQLGHLSPSKFPPPSLKFPNTELESCSAISCHNLWKY